MTSDEDTRSESPKEDLLALCSEAGWKTHSREEGLAVELDVPGFFQEALITSTPKGIRVQTILLRDCLLDTQSRKAIKFLMHRLNAAVRLIRAGSSLNREQQTSVWLEAEVPGRCGEELLHVLQALSVACRISVAEIDVLQDRAVAEVYLRMVVRKRRGRKKGERGNGKEQHH